MKTRTTLLIALGLGSSYAALAQLRPPPQPMPLPAPTQDTPAQGCCGTPSESGMTPSAPSPSSSGPDASGSSTTMPPASSGTSGATGASGTMGTPSGTPSESSGALPGSSGASGLQSEAGAELRPPPSPIARLQPQTQNDVTYLCGGVGQEEASYMKKEARGYDLMLTFATRDGGYLADVNVDIKDAKGNPVLQTSCDSPILLVDLPRSGTYRIHADTAGYTLNKTARVNVRQGKASRVASVVLTWPQQVAEAPSSAGTASGSSGGRSNGNNNSNNSGEGGGKRNDDMR